MSLVAVASPASEPERAAMVSLLDANGIPCLVRGGNFATLLPGLSIGTSSTATLMVPEHMADQARALLAVFSAPDPPLNDPAD